MSRNKMKNNKILITGVSGLLGNNLAYYFKDRGRVLGLYNLHPVNIDSVLTCKCDITSAAQFKKAVKGFKPDVIVHCASLTNIDFCETNKKLTYKVNVHGTKIIADAIKKTGIKLIYISSDSVYDGVNGNFSEDDHVKPLNYYGVTKYEGEREILKHSNSLILRTNLFGWNILDDKYSLAEWILNELRHGREIKGFKDVFFSSIYTLELARILEMAVKKDLKGIYNCGSRTSLSKYEFALQIAEKFGLDKKLIIPISIDEFDFRAKRGKKFSLDVKKLEGVLGCRIPALPESIDLFYRDYLNGLPKSIKKEEKYIPYGKHCIDEEDIKEVAKVLRSDRITQGGKVKEFEDALCEYAGAKYAVAVSSGTAALHIACLVAGLKEQDEFITSTNTFVASANCGVYCGATPVFSDMAEDTYNIDPEKIREKITPKTKIVIPVHFAGQICDMAKIKNIIEEKQAQSKGKIFMIEDASHALGSVYRRAKAGSCVYSDMTVMSFHPVKHITTGEGGVVFTNDQKLYKKLKLLRSHGVTGNEEDFVYKERAYGPSCLNPWYYEQQALGFNYRITDIQCALGISQLKKIGYFLKRRRKIFEAYNNAFAGNKLITIPAESPDCLTNWHLYVLQIDFDALGKDRAYIMKRLKEKGVGTQVHYIPVHTQPFYRKNFGTNWGDCPRAEAYSQKCLSIPIFSAMTDKDIKKVISAVLRLS